MILDHLSNFGLFVLLIFCFLSFLVACFTTTSSWHEIVLDQCTSTSGAAPLNPNPYLNDQIKLYLQPNTGVCWVANAISSTDDQCYTWGDSTFWSQWAKNTSTGSDGTDAVDSAPRVYSLAIATVFMALIPMLLICFHYYMPDSLSRYVTQFLTGLFMIMVLIFSGAAPANANGSMLSDDQNWKTYYIKSGLTCENVGSSMYVGGGLAVFNIFLATFAAGLALIPGVACKYFTDGGGSSGGDDKSGLSEASTNDIKASLVNGDEAQSQYIPPSV